MKCKQCGTDCGACCCAILDFDFSTDAERYPTISLITGTVESKNGLVRKKYSELLQKNSELESRISALEAGLREVLSGHITVKPEEGASPAEKRDNKPSVKNGAADDVAGERETVEENPADDVTVSHREPLRPGDVVCFGNYKSNTIEWIVLKREKRGTLLFSRYMLDHKPFAQEKNALSSTIPEWLNREFIAEAFSEEELASIKPADISGPVSVISDSAEGQEKLFLLSAEEYRRYAKINGVTDFGYSAHDLTVCCYNISANARTWWLRSQNPLPGRAFCVSKDSGIVEVGKLDYYIRGIRPAMFIDDAVLFRGR